MLVAYLLTYLLCNANCMNISVPQPSYNEKLTRCITDIVVKYFTENKVLTYVGNKVEDEELLKSINTENVVSVLSKKSSKKSPIPHQAYLITVKNAVYFAEHFPNVTKEVTWNPLARFLVIVRDLPDSEIHVVFDTFLKLHANNVLVVNATEDAHLYTYNPFDNYNCGKRYDTVISYGKCLEVNKTNLYPKKTVTALNNCTFNVLIKHWPPYTLISTNDSDKSIFRQGAETYILKLIGKKQGFKINVSYDYSPADEFTTVTNDMDAMGVLKKVQDNEIDIVLGGMLLTPSRARAFDYVFGHLAYTDEIRFVVKRASTVPPWKDIYLEFGWTVWVLLILALMIYSILVIILLRTDDKSYVVLMLLDNILGHGRIIDSTWTVKCILIVWVWFAYLVNTFYQSSLFSLTTNPSQEYQISNEEDIVKYQLKPCFSSLMEEYYTESAESLDGYQKIDGCSDLMESVLTVAKSNNLYTIMLYGQYLYNEQAFFDEYGNSRVVTLPKPYSKVMYSMYLYKGFPMMQYLFAKSIRLRENGLVQKVMSDVNYMKQIKHRFRGNEFQGRFAIPWRVYVFGCLVSVIVFIIELNMFRIKLILQPLKVSIAAPKTCFQMDFIK